MAQQQQSMADKVRNLTAAELHAREREQSEQLFKLKFQMKMGQTESVKKLRELRKEIARIKTVAREKELGIARRRTGVAGPAGPQRESQESKEGDGREKDGGRQAGEEGDEGEESNAQEDGEEVSHGRNRRRTRSRNRTASS